MNNRNILVTGGAGYVGSHICKILKDKGYTPVVFDNLSTGHKEFVKWGPLYVGDILSLSDLESAFQKFSISSVIHCAAKAYVSESVSNPIKYYRENINGSINLLETFIKYRGSYFVFSSSCAVYGNTTNIRIKENHEATPINPYGFTKLAIEKLILDLKNIHKFNFAILRYFNAAGAELESNIGEWHEPETHVIPLMINSLKTQDAFKIFGNDYSTYDGTAIRDFVHVSDLALAHTNSLEFLASSKQDILCNIGSGDEISVLDLVLQMQKLDPEFHYIFEKRRTGDPEYLVANNELSKIKLKMEYKNSNISNILKTALQWSKNITINSNQ
jgi:UDP-glucose-4-epimerase GalE